MRRCHVDFSVLFVLQETHHVALGKDFLCGTVYLDVQFLDVLAVHGSEAVVDVVGPDDAFRID